MKAVILSLGLFAAVGAAAAVADEREIKIEELPRAVRDAVAAKFPKARLVEASKEEEDGETVYEVALKDDGVAVDVSVSAKGRILEVERAIAPDKLPEAVRAAVKAKHPKAEIKKAEEVVSFDEDGDDEDGDKYFEVELTVDGGKGVELKISPKGKVLDDDEADGDHEGAGDEKDDD